MLIQLKCVDVYLRPRTQRQKEAVQVRVDVLVPYIFAHTTNKRREAQVLTSNKPEVVSKSKNMHQPKCSEQKHVMF